MAKKGRKKGGVQYTNIVTNAINKWKLNSEIINQSELSKETRKEITRVFHAANRRLQNIENGGYLSPAANAVNKYLSENPVAAFNKFAKFSTAGKSFDELKRDYAAAIEFLKKPTSTATGAKQFEKEIKKQLEKKRKVTDAEFNYIKNLLLSDSVGNYGVVMALVPSDPQKVLDVFTEASKDISDEIENAAKNLSDTDKLSNGLELDIDRAAKAGFPDDPRPLFEAFDTFKN